MPPENVERADIDWHYKMEEPETKPDHSFAIGIVVITVIVGVIITLLVVTVQKINRERLKVEAPIEAPKRYTVEVQNVTNCYRVTTIHDTKTGKTFVSMDDGVHLTQIEP